MLIVVSVFPQKWREINLQFNFPLFLLYFLVQIFFSRTTDVSVSCVALNLLWLNTNMWQKWYSCLLFSLLRATRLCHCDQQLLLPCQTRLLHQASGSGEGTQAAAQTGRTSPQSHHEHQPEPCQGTTQQDRKRWFRRGGCRATLFISSCTSVEKSSSSQWVALHSNTPTASVTDYIPPCCEETNNQRTNQPLRWLLRLESSMLLGLLDHVAARKDEKRFRLCQKYTTSKHFVKYVCQCRLSWTTGMAKKCCSLLRLLEAWVG